MKVLFIFFGCVKVIFVSFFFILCHVDKKGRRILIIFLRIGSCIKWNWTQFKKYMSNKKTNTVKKGLTENMLTIIEKTIHTSFFHKVTVYLPILTPIWFKLFKVKTSERVSDIHRDVIFGVLYDFICHIVVGVKEKLQHNILRITTVSKT